MNERFQFLKSYSDVINQVAKADEWLAEKLCMKIVRYGIEWIDEDSGNPILEWLFVQIKIMIDKGQEISEKNKENWKKWWRPKNRNKTETKPNWNQTETELKPKKTKIENRKEKIENNVITLSNDNEEKLSYWNDDINKCLELIKTYNNGIVDWTQQNQRRFAKHLINKLNWLENVKKGKFTRYETLDILLKIISQNKFYCTKITSPEKIYRELGTLMSVCKKDIQDKSTESIVLETL